MFQTLRTTRTANVPSADTAAHRFAAAPARLVYFQAATTITGTVTILGVDGGTLDTAGIVLAAGDTYQTWVEDMSQLGYQFSVNAGTESLKVARSY